MIKILSLITIAATALMLLANVHSNAAEVYLCIDETNETVTMMDKEGLCLEGENEVIYKEMKSDQVLPVARFSPNDECESGGKIVELGFDKNENGELDDGEVATNRMDCKIVD